MASILDDIVGTAKDAWDKGTEWVEDKVDDVKGYATSVAYKNWVAENLGGPTRMTKELEEAGWKEGLDGIPYNANLVGIHDPGGIYYDPDREDNLAAANAAVTGGSTGGNTGTTGSGSFLSQDLRQRTPSGTMYNPDISEYLNSGLFNYTGPGGVPEYTYGQGLRTDGADYGIWGTPTDVPNPYYWGQFGEGYAESTGVADGAISLPPVDLPAGVSPTNNNPNVGTPTTNINTGGNNTGGNNTGGGGTGPDGKDLTYQETLDYFGLDPVSTIFSGPNDKLIEEAIMNQDAVKETLPSGILDWVGGANEAGVEGTRQWLPTSPLTALEDGSGIADTRQWLPTSPLTALENQSGIADTRQWLPTSPLTALEDESGIADTRQWLPTSPLTALEDESGIGGAYQEHLSNQKNFEIANSMVGGLLENNIIRNPNQETQSYRGIYVDPRTVPEIDAVQSNTLYPPTMPANYEEGNNISLVTTTDKPYDDGLEIVWNPPGSPTLYSFVPKDQVRKSEEETYTILDDNSGYTETDITDDEAEETKNFFSVDLVSQAELDKAEAKRQGMEEAKARLAEAESGFNYYVPSGFANYPNPSEARVQDYIQNTPQHVSNQLQSPFNINDRGGIGIQSIFREPHFSDISVPSSKPSLFSTVPIWMGGL